MAPSAGPTGPQRGGQIGNRSTAGAIDRTADPSSKGLGPGLVGPVERVGGGGPTTLGEDWVEPLGPAGSVSECGQFHGGGDLFQRGPSGRSQQVPQSPFGPPLAT